MNEVLVSIIIPLYNAEMWIERCVRSLQKQIGFKNIELVLVDDGSTDHTPMIADALANDKNIVCIHKSNGGVSSARNTGINAARGTYITFVDADDYVDDSFTSNLLNEILSGCDIACSGFVVEYPNISVKKSASKKHVMDGRQALKEFLVGSVIEPGVCNKMFKRELIGALRFDESFSIAEDKYFLFKYLQKVKKCIVLPEASYHYVMNNDSACHKDFSQKNLDSLYVTDKIVKETKRIDEKLYNVAESMCIDVKCRIYCDIYRTKSINKYKKDYLELKSKIKGYSVIKKYHYSSKKHFFAFIAARIHPSVYCFLKNDMKLQYK